PMKRQNSRDKRDESLASRLGRAAGDGTHGKCVLEELQHRPARSAVMLLRMVDDEDGAGGKRGLDRQDGGGAAREVGDGRGGRPPARSSATVRRDTIAMPSPAMTLRLTASGLSNVIVRVGATRWRCHHAVVCRRVSEPSSRNSQVSVSSWPGLSVRARASGAFGRAMITSASCDTLRVLSSPDGNAPLTMATAKSFP